MEDDTKAGWSWATLQDMSDTALRVTMHTELRSRSERVAFDAVSEGLAGQSLRLLCARMLTRMGVPARESADVLQAALLSHPLTRPLTHYVDHVTMTAPPTRLVHLSEELPLALAASSAPPPRHEMRPHPTRVLSHPGAYSIIRPR